MKGKIILIITTTTFNIFPEWDVYIGTKDPEFYQTGLKAASVLENSLHLLIDFVSQIAIDLPYLAFCPLIKGKTVVYGADIAKNP